MNKELNYKLIELKKDLMEEKKILRNQKLNMEDTKEYIKNIKNQINKINKDEKEKLESIYELGEEIEKNIGMTGTEKLLEILTGKGLDKRKYYDKRIKELSYLNDDEKEKILQDYLTEKLGEDLKIKVEVDDEWYTVIAEGHSAIDYTYENEFDITTTFEFIAASINDNFEYYEYGTELDEETYFDNLAIKRIEEEEELIFREITLGDLKDYWDNNEYCFEASKVKEHIYKIKVESVKDDFWFEDEFDLSKNHCDDISSEIWLQRDIVMDNKEKQENNGQ